ncbi:MAG: S9 family peptidase, partial [Nitrososphaerota archaeon]|nr:S9 family peptidase [Nitrososphaerota archaeon]
AQSPALLRGGVRPAAPWLTADELHAAAPDDVMVISRPGIWFNGKGFTYNKRHHIFRVDLNGKSPSQVTKGSFDVGEFAVSHDGLRLAYLAVTDDLKPYISDLVVLDLRNKRSRKLTRSNMEIEALAWSPDDNSIAFAGDDLPSGFASHVRIWVARLRTGRVWSVDETDMNKSNGLNSDMRTKAHGTHKVLWATEGIYHVQADGGSVGLYRLKPDSRPAAIVVGPRSVEGFDVSSGRVAFVAMDSSHLEELYLLAGREKRLTSFNAETLKLLDIRPSSPFRFKASDGQQIEGWVILPSSKGKVPAVLYVHGGPKTAFGQAYMHEFQTFAGAGYAVIYMNPRGSDGYSEKFADIRGAYGSRDFQDLMEGLDYVLARQRRIDGSRLAIAGGSYGGYMTNWAIGHTTRFRAAVADRSIANWVSMWGVSDIGPHFTNDQMMADPWDGDNRLVAESPLTFAKEVMTPLLLIHSTEDYRCPIPEGIQFFTALKQLGKKAELVVFPGENHDLSRTGKPKHRLSRLKHYIRWFDAHLK